MFSFSLDVDRQLNREAKNMPNVILVVAVIFFSYMFDLHVCDTCPSSDRYCTVEQWAPWRPCNATCGRGVQERQKMICCDTSLYHSLKGCLNGCNIPISWWQAHATEYKTCGQCQRGGTFDVKQNSCICPSGYEGSCCDKGAITSCSGNPCQQGKCIPMKNHQYLCLCSPGYEGHDCDKVTSWAMSFISLASLALLIAFCCCYRCICGTLKRDDEKKKVEPLRKKSRPQPMERPPRYDDW
ncbi:NOTCH1 [Mytilus edulis]|uniref:NOTCH1 n=1 Tax=Mytilus edulis TaxID=6550 RepID=A0A8S3SS16_MYTED|nr:NOTCH1 [Mytilus edulis]